MKTFTLAITGILLALATVACASPTSPASTLAGTYTWTVSKADSAAHGWTSDLICENAGKYEMTFAPTGSSSLIQTPVEDCPAAVNSAIVGTWAVTGDQLTYHEITDTGCGTPTVVYTFKTVGNELHLNKVSDTCQFSASDKELKVWTKINKVYL